MIFISTKFFYANRPALHDFGKELHLNDAQNAADF